MDPNLELRAVKAYMAGIDESMRWWRLCLQESETPEKAQKAIAYVLKQLDAILGTDQPVAPVRRLRADD